MRTKIQLQRSTLQWNSQWLRQKQHLQQPLQHPQRQPQQLLQVQQRQQQRKFQHDNRLIIVVNLLFCCKKIASNSFQGSKNDESDNVERKKSIATQQRFLFIFWYSRFFVSWVQNCQKIDSGPKILENFRYWKISENSWKSAFSISEINKAFWLQKILCHFCTFYLYFFMKVRYRNIKNRFRRRPQLPRQAPPQQQLPLQQQPPQPQQRLPQLPLRQG